MIAKAWTQGTEHCQQMVCCDVDRDLKEYIIIFSRVHNDQFGLQSPERRKQNCGNDMLFFFLWESDDCTKKRVVGEYPNKPEPLWNRPSEGFIIV